MFVDSLKTIADSTIVSVANGGFLDTDWTTYMVNNIVYFLLGLVATFLYFWFIIRANTVEQDSFKEFFAIKKNQNSLYLHLVLYVGFILMWLLMDIALPAQLLGEPLKFIFSLISMDITEKISGAYATISNIFPKGKLSAITIIFGGGMTFIVRNCIPAIGNWFKNFFKKKSQ